MIILPTLNITLTHFSSEGWENVLFKLGRERVKMAAVSPVAFQMSPEEEKAVPVYVLVVHCAAENTSSPTAEGWVVTRRLKDFHTLHSKLKEVRTDWKERLTLYKLVNGMT